LVGGCCDRAAEVTASPISRTSKSAMRFIGSICSEPVSSGDASWGIPHDRQKDLPAKRSIPAPRLF
jgi:hypothetical protein